MGRISVLDELWLIPDPVEGTKQTVGGEEEEGPHWGQLLFIECFVLSTMY